MRDILGVMVDYATIFNITHIEMLALLGRRVKLFFIIMLKTNTSHMKMGRKSPYFNIIGPQILC